jgi:hypothetical protein
MKTIEIKENRTISSYPENFVDSTTRKKTFKDTEGRDIFSYFTEILPNENGAVLNMPLCKENLLFALSACESHPDYLYNVEIFTLAPCLAHNHI